jgi:hypothetical protein
MRSRLSRTVFEPAAPRALRGREGAQWAPVTEDVRLNLVETRTFGSRVIYERYGHAGDESD